MAELLLEEELEMLKKTVQSFIRKHVETAEQFPGVYIKGLPKEVVAQLQKKAQEVGLWAMGARNEWGGAELSIYERVILLEEASQHRFGLYHPAADAFGGEFPRFLEKCTPHQIESVVKPAVKVGKGCFVALWEEQEDNYLENLTAAATREGNDWIINGQKAYIQNYEQAAFGVVLVNCLLDNGEKKPTLFLLESKCNLETGEINLIDVQTTHSISFHHFRAQDNQIIGTLGEGAALIKQWLAESQILLAARCLGVSVKAMDYGKQYAKLRITRGRPLSEFPTIRTLLAKAAIQLQSARLMVHDAAKKADQYEHGWILAAQMAKLQATETASKIIDDVLQIHGGSGITGDLPIERWYKEIRIARADLLKAETIFENVAQAYL